MDAPRRKKWVEIADRYPKMKPQEQQRLQKRLVDWAKLTPEQRTAARDKYQALKKLPPDKRKEVTAQWQRYQQSLAQQPRFLAIRCAGATRPADSRGGDVDGRHDALRHQARRHGHCGDACAGRAIAARRAAHHGLRR